ncbi:60S ribosomal protein L9-like [Quercus robur]|uniref:60S ribosomal protein L9-like n=1 Tax=Quercus robur TaxID=38942 RepID=UPI002162B192|nr:60S ribosomal protein L9-like [Quercus robur]
MKTILSFETMDIPDGVKIKVNTKAIEVEGPRGKFIRNFKHLNLDFDLITNKDNRKRKLKIDAWFGSKKTSTAIHTALSHIKNLIIGVIKGYRYKMRFVYAHFPINASITNTSNKSIEIRNFLGEKKVRKVDMLDGVTILRSEKVKDELVLNGNDIELVSRSVALINQNHVKNKDIRKFLDDIYVSERGTIVEEE